MPTGYHPRITPAAITQYSIAVLLICCAYGAEEAPPREGRGRYPVSCLVVLPLALLSIAIAMA